MRFTYSYYSIFPDPCATKLCLENEECVEDSESGDAKCVCRKCPEVSPFNETEEVCGSDGITYYSLCYLQQASCMQNEDIYAMHYGPCGKNK